jgi:hypothetical protein
MSLFRIAILSALGAAMFGAPASAWPYIDVTASEALSLDPPRYRTTFDLSFVGYNPGGGAAFFIEPLEVEPAAQLFECQAPTSWSCHSLPPNGTIIDFYPSGDPWPSALTFSIVTDQAVPCVRFVFWDPLLGKVPGQNLAFDYVVDACLQVDMPVPTRPSTWGSLKSRYR